MPGKIELTHQTIIDICEQFKAGHSIPELMKTFKLCRNKITRVLKEQLGQEYKTYAQKIIALSGKKAALKNRGRKLPHTPEWNKKIGDAQRGRKLSIEQRQKISDANKARMCGPNPSWTVEKHREAMKKAAETKRQRGYYEIHSKRHSEWMRLHAPNRGKKMSQESRRKMSEAKKSYYAHGGKCPALGRIKTQEEREKLKASTAKMWKDGKFQYGNGLFRSKMEIKVFEECQKYDAQTQHSFRLSTPEKSYIFDIFVPSLNLIIEVNGDYWHLNPTLYDTNYVDTSRQIAARDLWAADDDRLNVARSQGYNTTIIWESDIKCLGIQCCVKNAISNTLQDVDQSK